MKFTFVLPQERGESADRAIVLSAIRRSADEFSDETLGLMLDEAKRLLEEIQRFVVGRQVADFVEKSRICRHCGASQAVREVRTRKIQTLFGVVEIDAPRLQRCACQNSSLGPDDRFSPVCDALPERTTRELRSMHADLGARHSYREAARLLAAFLPTARFNHASVRNRLSVVAKEMGATCPRTNFNAANDNRIASRQEQSTPSEMVVVIDHAHIKSTRGGKWRTIDVAVGKIETPGLAPRRFGFANEGDADAMLQIRTALKEQGWCPCMPVTVLTDGDSRLPNLVAAAAGPNCIHILDWWHVSVKIRHVETALRTLLGIEPHCDVVYGYASFYVDRLRHLVWNGYGEEAARDVYRIMNRSTVLPDNERLKFYSAEFLRTCRELHSYLRLNRTSLVNYGRRYRAGLVISTSRAESCVEEIANARMSKKRRMRWSPKGAHRMAVVRSAVLDGRLDARPAPIAA